MVPASGSALRSAQGTYYGSTPSQPSLPSVGPLKRLTIIVLACVMALVLGTIAVMEVVNVISDMAGSKVMLSLAPKGAMRVASQQSSRMQNTQSSFAKGLLSHSHTIPTPLQTIPHLTHPPSYGPEGEGILSHSRQQATASGRSRESTGPISHVLSMGVAWIWMASGLASAIGLGLGMLTWAHVRLAKRNDPAPVAMYSISGTKDESPDTAGIPEGWSRTRAIMESVATRSKQAGGAGGGTTYEALQRVDGIWERIRNMKTGAEAGAAPEFLKVTNRGLGDANMYDVVVCGGTLGILMGCALQLKGWKVAVLEQGPLQGREQDWNISRKEMDELVEIGILTHEDLDNIIRNEFNPVRCGFHGGTDVYVQDILNLGVSPIKLVERLRARFEAAGGQVMERTGLTGAEVCPDGVKLSIASSGKESKSGSAITTRLVLDCMGFGSPIVRQARWGQKPDGVCLVVGSMGRGFDATTNTGSDLIYTTTPITEDGDGTLQGQYFWEAFPASSGPQDRTTYMFSYMDADSHRPSLEDMFEDYWDLMPKYQGVDLEDIEVQRVLFGFFPTFRDSPLAPISDRVLQIGDASGVQSPLSFGGFGAMTRHLGRLSGGISESLELDCLDQQSLGKLNPYMPNLSAAWLFQRAMSVPLGSRPPRDFINKLLSTNFSVMENLGDPILRGFLQDVIQFSPLGSTLAGMVRKDPLFALSMPLQLGPGPVADWLKHFLAMGFYDVLYKTAGPVLEKMASPVKNPNQYKIKRTLEEWEFGSGNDYKA